MNVTVPGQRKVLGYYGADAQAVIHMEECAELIQAVSKMRRVRHTDADDTEAYYNLVEEVADVLICLEQIQEMYGIPDHEIQTAVSNKCARQEARMHESH